MQHLAEVALGLLTTMAAVLWPTIRAALRASAEAAAQRALADIQARLGGGASRVAGEIAAAVRADGLAAAPPALIDNAARLLKERYAETLARLDVPDSTLIGMVKGELGKLGVAAK